VIVDEPQDHWDANEMNGLIDLVGMIGGIETELSLSGATAARDVQDILTSSSTLRVAL
jgi:hypothetical protein